MTKWISFEVSCPDANNSSYKNDKVRNTPYVILQKHCMGLWQGWLIGFLIFIDHEARPQREVCALLAEPFDLLP